MSTKGKVTFQGAIIQKFMTAEEFQKFIEKYYQHRGQRGGARLVNDTDRQIFADYKVNKMSINDIAKKYSCSHTRVNTAIVKAVLE